MTKNQTISGGLLKTLFSQFPADLVYLYGSRASGNEDSRSDYDFGVLFEDNLKEKKRFDLRLELFGKIASELKVSSDIIDLVDLDEVPVLLQFNVIKGIAIYNKNEERRVSFETEVMRDYHDGHYYLDRYLKETLVKIEKGVFFERGISYDREKAGEAGGQ